MSCTRARAARLALRLLVLQLLLQLSGCATDPGAPDRGAAPEDRAADALLRLPRSGGPAGSGPSPDHVPDPAPRPPQPADGVPTASSPRFAWRCDDGARPETRWDAGSGDLILHLDGERLVLRTVRMASGAAWEGGPEGTVRFWNQGDEAMLTAPERETRCSIDPVRSADLRAAAEGASFRALGNEPGWNLVIRPERIDWVTDYGATRSRFADPAMRERGELEIWEAGAGAQRLRVEIGPGPCLDAAGRSFPATVTVLEGDRRLPGCGSSLQRPID